jgi:hypothetical protein
MKHKKHSITREVFKSLVFHDVEDLLYKRSNPVIDYTEQGMFDVDVIHAECFLILGRRLHVRIMRLMLVAFKDA